MAPAADPNPGFRQRGKEKALPSGATVSPGGPYPSGGIGLILLILIIMLLLGGFEAREFVLTTNDIEESGDFEPP